MKISASNKTGNYSYDIANRLTAVDGVIYTWDNNGNLLSDGVNTYSYDLENRLTGVTDGVDNYVYAYNASGDRLQQTINSVPTNYTLDLIAPYTQVLADSTNTYQYGLVRIAQQDTSNTLYFIPDAIGSVRQMVDGTGNVVLANSYDPFGNLVNSSGTESSPYGFTGEYTDFNGLVYLRARIYDPNAGRFTSKDIFEANFE